MTQSSSKAKAKELGVFDESTESLLFKIHFEINGISKVIQDSLANAEGSSNGVNPKEVLPAHIATQPNRQLPAQVFAMKTQRTQSLDPKTKRVDFESTHPIFGIATRIQN